MLLFSLLKLGAGFWNQKSAPIFDLKCILRYYRTFLNWNLNDHIGLWWWFILSWSPWLCTPMASIALSIFILPEQVARLFILIINRKRKWYMNLETPRLLTGLVVAQFVYLKITVLWDTEIWAVICTEKYVGRERSQTDEFAVGVAYSN